MCGFGVYGLVLMGIAAACAGGVGMVRRRLENGGDLINVLFKCASEDHRSLLTRLERNGINKASESRSSAGGPGDAALTVAR